jgi:L,D-transpeptidase catalytic domain
MRRSAAAVMLLSCSLGMAPPALAGGSKVSSPLELAKQADKLKPGEWVWAPKIARTGPVLVYVELDRQLATVYRNGVRIGVSTISSGKPGLETPTGVFTILEKDVDHRSRTYDNAPMPYMNRLTWKGVALHAGNLPGFPASHGCVRLPLEFAKLVYGVTPKGGTVVIANSHGDPYKKPAAGVLTPSMVSGHGAVQLPLGDKQDFSWFPELSPTGPTSIIISTSDQRVVVMRNGIEIGRAKAVVAQQLDEAQVMTLTQSRAGKSEWIQVGVSNLAHQDADVVSTEGVDRMHLPAAFIANMRAIMTPGTTVLVTKASVGEQTTGVQTTVLASEPDGIEQTK